ncbi:uncharacterized protein LOC117300701 [Asterias rubens]|uniref:uncharacterized protein LOC117300701 n=1 Tax=Asterias rubens TaxID=7604 RepID=UPI0014554B4E|nr:uncharacterized protein LOC117300701 [Asterias rubens]
MDMWPGVCVFLSMDLDVQWSHQRTKSFNTMLKCSLMSLIRELRSGVCSRDLVLFLKMKVMPMRAGTWCSLWNGDYNWTCLDEHVGGQRSYISLLAGRVFILKMMKLFVS